MNKRQRIEIFSETMDIIHAERERYGFMDHVIKRYDDKSKIEDPCPGYETIISITYNDTLYEVQNLIDETSDKTGFLVMASEKNRGGGVQNGAQAQEEDILRRCDLFPSYRHISYPIKNHCTIAFDNVQIFRLSSSEDSTILDVPYKATALLSPAIRRPRLVSVDDRRKYQINMKKKIDILLTAAVKQKCVNIVLGAWGCGAFYNPPELVAKCFKDVITEKYIGWFKKIVFAILDGRRTSNYITFKGIFED